MVKHAQTIRRQRADELFECVWPFCKIGAEGVKSHLWRSSCVVKFFLRLNFFTGTFKGFMVIIPKVVIFFLDRNTSNNKFLDLTNKETNKVMWYGCCSLYVMNLK